MSETATPTTRRRWLHWAIQIPGWLIFAWAMVLYANGIRITPGAPVGVAAAVLGYFLCIVVHEFGHAVAALLVRWRVIVFAVRPLAWHLVNREVVPMRGSQDEELGGYVFAVPSQFEAASAVRWAIFVAGGPVLNILVGVAAVGLAIASPSRMDRLSTALVAFAFGLQSLQVGLGALVPDAWGGRRSDGGKLLTLCRHEAEWKKVKALSWLHAHSEYRVRLAERPAWLVAEAAREAADFEGAEQNFTAMEIGTLLDREPVDASRVRALMDAYRERYGVNEWQASCDAYLAAVWEGDGARAAGLLWCGETTTELKPMRLAAEAAVAARLGQHDATRAMLNLMDTALREQSAFRDATFRDIRRQIEALFDRAA